MAITYLKKAARTPDTESGNARRVVEDMLGEIERRGEVAVREYAEKLDRWTGDIVVGAEEIERRTAGIDAATRRVIEFRVSSCWVVYVYVLHPAGIFDNLPGVRITNSAIYGRE